MLLALETPPSNKDPLFWADFAEFRALIHPDKCYSRGDLVGLSQRVRDTASNRTFKADQRWRDLISFAEARQHEFSTAYPFRVSDDKDTLELAYDNRDSQRSYLQLLLASLMRHIPFDKRGDLARTFEESCFSVFSKLMPEGSEIRATWANGGNAAVYQGTLIKKMNLLARDIRCTANFKARDFKSNDSGDGGIDLIAWHPMSDAREGLPIAFAQCGCSKEDWRFKQLEASPAMHIRHLPVMHPWSTYYFLPIDLRDADGGWAYASDLGSVIIVDRLRILRLIKQYNLYTTLPKLNLLDEVQAFSYH
jgi:hypothetical protein